MRLYIYIYECFECGSPDGCWSIPEMHERNHVFEFRYPSIDRFTTNWIIVSGTSGVPVFPPRKYQCWVAFFFNCFFSSWRLLIELQVPTVPSFTTTSISWTSWWVASPSVDVASRWALKQITAGDLKYFGNLRVLPKCHPPPKKSALLRGYLFIELWNSEPPLSWEGWHWGWYP